MSKAEPATEETSLKQGYSPISALEVMCNQKDLKTLQEAFLRARRDFWDNNDFSGGFVQQAAKYLWAQGIVHVSHLEEKCAAAVKRIEALEAKLKYLGYDASKVDGTQSPEEERIQYFLMSDDEVTTLWGNIIPIRTIGGKHYALDMDSLDEEEARVPITVIGIADERPLDLTYLDEIVTYHTYVDRPNEFRPVQGEVLGQLTPDQLAQTTHYEIFQDKNALEHPCFEAGYHRAFVRLYKEV